MVALVLLGLVVFIVLVLASGIRFVPQASEYVIERFGVYKDTWSAGFHWLIPGVDRVSQRVSLKEHVIDFDPQGVITRDNVTMEIDSVVFYQVTDAKLNVYGVNKPLRAIENLTATTLRNIVGDLELDETLTSRDLINTKMRDILDEATDPWGIKINRVEVKNILPPRNIQEAMEKQMRAERERRQLILLAEGDKRSAILKAEGLKEATILEAEGNKQQRIKQAQGESEAIIILNRATAEGIKAIKLAGADQAVLAIKSFEALVKVADGKATKLIIPSEIQNVAGLVASLAEIGRDVKEPAKVAKPKTK